MKKETQTPPEKQPAVVKKELTARILNKVQAFTSAGELQLPGDYSPANALKGAMLMLDDMKALQKYEPNSIAQSLLRMVVEGLSPIKGQGYFVPYGKELNWSRSYQGSIALAKRVANVDKVPANVIYEGDDFAYEIDAATGFKKLIKHNQQLENIDNSKIRGAYAIVLFNDGTSNLEVMTMAEIRQAWNQGATKGNSPAHKNFTQEMAKKTVINRACKGPINSSSDAGLFANEESAPTMDAFEEVKTEIIDETASETVDFEEVKEPTKSEKDEKKPAKKAAEKPKPEEKDEKATTSAIKPSQEFDEKAPTIDKDGQSGLDLENTGPGY